MDRRNLIIAGLGLGLAASASGSTRAEETEAEPLRRASRRGRMIYDYDQAAWHSTDAAMAQLPEAQRKKVGGYVVEPAPGALRATYYSTEAGKPRALFTAEVHGREVRAGHVVAAGEDGSLSATAERLVAARKVAVADVESRGLRPCTNGAFNTVVLPPEPPGEVTPVYVLSPEVKAGEFPAGGHYEIDVAADGTIAFRRAFTRSCINLGGQALPPGAKPAAAMVSHLLDPTPTEIHVFLALSMGQPLFVVTGADHLWRVDGDRIALVDGKVRG